MLGVDEPTVRKVLASWGVGHDNQVFELGLSDSEKGDLIEYLKSL